MSVREPESGLTILLLLSWLNYGGVESYVIRLAQTLSRRGHRVLLVSNGGQLASEVKAAGLEHYRINFTGLRMLFGLRALCKLLEREQVDLVNAHNWRAGMIAAAACRLAGIPYIMTIHGTRDPFHRFSVFYWSKRVVVMSEQSRSNLIQDFGLSPERVEVATIGVDCERFSPTAINPQLEVELELRAGALRIIHVSRFSHSKVGVALALIEAMLLLDRQISGIELVLVGQGGKEREVAVAAEKMNQRLGRKAVLMLGGRPDIFRLLPLATVVVGTATVAREAMACGKPVVAAGKGGYFGIVTPDNLVQAESTCFGDHGALPVPVSAERLAADLADLLLSPERAHGLGRFGRENAELHFSTTRAADEIENIYQKVLCERGKVHRIQVYHLNQIGDLMFTLPALKTLREAFPKARITSVLRPQLADLVAHTGLVDKVMHRPRTGLLSAFLFGLRLRRKQPDLAVVLSQSATTTWWAWLSGARQRIGYVDSDLCRLLNHRVQVRGIPSPRKVMRLIRCLGLQSSKENYVGLVHLSKTDEDEGKRLLTECSVVGLGPLIALAPGEAGSRSYKSWSAEGFREVTSRLIQEDQARLVIVGSEQDRELGDQIAPPSEYPHSPAPSPCLERGSKVCNLAGKTTPAQLAAVLSCCDFLIGIDSGPLHLAAAMGRPVVGLFGPTDPAITGPQGEGHEIVFHEQPCWRPCIHPVIPNCRERKCMQAISPEEVLIAARRIIARLARAGDPSAGSRLSSCSTVQVIKADNPSYLRAIDYDVERNAFFHSH